MYMNVEKIVEHLDHHSEEFGEDPWAVYGYLRKNCPVKWSDQYGGFWLLTRYEDVQTVAKDDVRFSSADGVTIPIAPQSPMIPIETDPPISLAFRRLLLPLFSQSVIEGIEPAIRKIANSLIDEVMDAGHLDFMDDFGGPIPAIITLRMVGIPEEEWRRFADPVHRAIFKQGFRENPSEEAANQEAFLWIISRSMELVNERRADPTDDIISRLVTGEIEGRSLTDDEIMRILLLIYAGGLDTTTMAIGNALAYLDRHPDRRQQLIENPGLMETAIEEFLRFEAPQQMLARTAKEDVVVGGQEIRAGERLQVCWASANRDPEAFENPDELDFARLPNRHATFGLGAHRCLGSTLARAEFRIALETVLERIPDYKIDWENAVRGESVGIVYGYLHLPAVF